MTAEQVLEVARQVITLDTYTLAVIRPAGAADQ